MTGPVTSTLTFTVTDDDTASAVGSGTLPVLGTPVLLAWCEAATCAAVEPALGPGETSVGTRVELEHTRATAVGSSVEVTATPVFADGRLHRFSVVAREAGSGESGSFSPGAGRVVATAEVTRVVVDVRRFLDRVSR